MYKRTILISIVISLLLGGHALAYGELTHYSINRDAGKNSIEDVSAATAPDAFANVIYGTNDLDTFVHTEIPGVLNDPLGPYISTSWKNGWMGHTIADRSSHGTNAPNSPYLDPNNYISAVGVTSLLDHYKAEFAGDILSYWYRQGTLPGSAVVYPNKIGDAFLNYDKNCGTSYSSEYNPSIYLRSYEALYASTYAEQSIIDYKLDRNQQFSDYILIAWARNKYADAFNRYYGDAVENVKDNTNTVETCILQTKINIPIIPSQTPQTTPSDKIKIEKMKIDSGQQLIDKGLIKLHEKFDDKTGAVTISLEPVDVDKIAKEYLSNIEYSYEKQTGKKIKILEEILSDI